jgi:hypothetical protein
MLKLLEARDRIWGVGKMDERKKASGKLENKEATTSSTRAYFSIPTIQE